MSASFCLVVLCPNARREIVKVSPNSSLLQVLEEACKRQNLNPEEYDLRHSNKALDLSLPVRFSSLPNNAQVELKPSGNSRKDSLVTVCLQLESGERFSEDFSPSVSVYNVIEQCLKSNSINIEEIGNPVCIYMRQKILGEALHTTSLRSLGLLKGKAIFRLLNRKPEDLAEQAHVSNPLPPQPFKDPAPAVKSYHQPDSPMPNYAEKQSHSGSYDPVSSQVMNVPKKEDSSVKETIEQANRCSKDLNEHENNVEMVSTSQEEMECDSELSDDNFQGISDIKYVGDRHAVLYCLDDITEIKKADLPDEFFDLTINDVKYLMGEYKRQRTEFENQPLLTKEQRERDILRKLAQYDQTVIRIYFPERLVLQAAFRSNETVKTVLDFIRDFLEQRNLKFYLYKTPPKEILDPSKTLLETLLIPAAVVYFGSESQQPNYLRSNLREQLSDPRAASLAASEARKNFTTSNTAVEIASENESKENQIQTQVKEETPVVNAVHNSGNIQTSGKVPKWLKLSKK